MAAALQVFGKCAPGARSRAGGHSRRSIPFSREGGESMRVVPWVIAVMAFALVACDEPNEARPAAPAAKADPPDGAATAEQVAKEARANVELPGKERSHAACRRRAGGRRDRRAPGHRVSTRRSTRCCAATTCSVAMQLDIRNSFDMERCARSRVTVSPRAWPSRAWSGPPSTPRWKAWTTSLRAQRQRRPRRREDQGQAKWYVGARGPATAEHVIDITREERFEAGASATIASIEQALLKKYGPPTKLQNDGASATSPGPTTWRGAWSRRAPRCSTAAAATPARMAA